MKLATIVICGILAACLTNAAELVVQQQQNSPNKVRYLQAGEIFTYEPLRRHRGFFEKDLRTYCYKGETKTLRRLFETVELILEIEGDDYVQYDGGSPEEVQKHYDEHRSLFSLNLFTQKKTRLALSPFLQSCMGIETIEPYNIRLHKVRVDFWRVIQLIIGCLVFNYAGKLSQNAVFYYITGVTLGICSSFMLLIWLTSKLVPRRTMMYGVLIGGWTIGLYVIQMLWENLQLIVLTYRTYVFWYICITGIVSFFFCYRWGPPTNQRSKNIIKWLLQLMSLVLIYLSSRYEEATAAIIIITLILYYFPRSLWYKGKTLWLSKFPPKRKFLSNEEYYEQGVKETTKALDELRKFANSPDCNQWRVMSKLRDPLRFAAFVEGASHLRDEEILHFESSRHSDDDELDDSDISLNDSDTNGAEAQQQHYSKSYNGYYKKISSPTNNDEDISEDDDDIVNNGRTPPTSLLQQREQRFYRNANSLSSSAQKQNSRKSYTTPTIYHSTLALRKRESSSAQRSSSRRSSYLRDHEYSDEG